MKSANSSVTVAADDNQLSGVGASNKFLGRLIANDKPAAPAHGGTVFPTEPIARPVNPPLRAEGCPSPGRAVQKPPTPPRMHRHEFDTAPRTDGALRQRQIGSPSQRGQML